MNRATDKDDQIQRSLTNIAAEAALLGGLMITNELIDTVAEKLKREDFAEPIHGDVYRAILRMRGRGEVISPVTLFPIFDNDPRFKELGGVGYLATLTANSAGVIGAIDLANQIAHLAGLRSARKAMEEALEKVNGNGEELPEISAIHGELEARLWEAQAHSEVAKFRNPDDMLVNVLSSIDSIRAGVSSGFENRWISDFNAAFGALEPETYHILGGRPGMGKTSAAVSALLGYAANGTPSLYLHAEMSDLQMDRRVMCNIGFALGYKFTIQQMRKGQFTEEETRNLSRIQQVSKLMPSQFMNVGRCDVSRINANVARSAAYWKAQGRKLGVVVVDYLQLLDAVSILGPRENNNERARASAVSGALLGIAQRHKVAVIALSQLSRKVEERIDRTPQMSDLRESGRIEEDADSVSFVYREEYYLEQMPKPVKTQEYEDHEAALGASRGKCDLIVAKNRHGKSMKRTMKFFGEHASVRGGDHTEFSEMFSGQHELFQENADVI